MKKKKTKKFLVRKIVVLLLFLIVIMLVRNGWYHFSVQKEQKQMRLLYNNEFVELIHKLYLEDEVVYISEKDVQKIFDDTIYYNIGDKELITTFNKHVAVLHLDEKQMMVNDSSLKMQGSLKEIDSEIYLPLTDLQIVYDVEIVYSSDTNMVIMDSTTKAKTRAMVLKDTKVKNTRSLLARTIQKVNTGDYVYVLEEDGRYQKIRTEAGNIGYVKAKKLFDQETLREDWIQEEYDESYFENSDELFLINEETTQIANVSSDLVTYTMRKEVINRVYLAVIEQGRHAVCIDFQNIDDINSFYRFVIELTPKFRESGILVSLKPNRQVDLEKVKKIVDFVYEEAENNPKS